MHRLLENLLLKRGIKNPVELSKDEATDFERWQKILSDGEMSVDKILEFCKNQVTIIETKWRDLDNAVSKNDRLIVMHTVYKAIMNIITSPKAERENLEKYLTQLLEK